MAQTRIGDVGRLAWFPSSRMTKWFVLVFWSSWCWRAASGPAGKLQRSPQQRSRRVAARRTPSRPRCVKQIDGVPEQERVPGRHRLRAAGGADHRPTSRPSPARSRSSTPSTPSSATAWARSRPQDGKALQVIVPIDAGERGWDSLGATVDELRDHRRRTARRAHRMHVTGPGGFAADSSAAFAGIDGKLLFSAMGVVIVILLLTYRSPMLWMLPGRLGRRRAVRRAGRHLLPRQARRA